MEPEERVILDHLASMRAYAMVTVPANALIAALPTDRMPAVPADEDWATWLGETGTAADAKACLMTVEGVNWKMAKEVRAARSKRRTATA
jgi:putative SOS response-associated peptidase YedK